MPPSSLLLRLAAAAGAELVRVLLVPRVAARVDGRAVRVELPDTRLATAVRARHRDRVSPRAAPERRCTLATNCPGFHRWRGSGLYCVCVLQSVDAGAELAPIERRVAGAFHLSVFQVLRPDRSRHRPVAECGWGG